MADMNGRFKGYWQIGAWVLSLVVAVLLTYGAAMARLAVVETQQREFERRLGSIDEAIQQIQATAISSHKVLATMLEIQQQAERRAVETDRVYRRRRLR